jgi:hypothetical protein
VASRNALFTDQVDWSGEMNRCQETEIKCSRIKSRESLEPGVSLDIISHAFNRGVRYEYQWGAVIAHFAIPDHDGGHYIAFMRGFGQWIRFDDCGVETVNESRALGENFPGTAASRQTARTLLYVLNTTQLAILERNNSATT